MQIIAHRINQIAQLNSLSPNYGVEIDVRSAGDRLILSHEPFCGGEDLDDWLMSFNHKTIIVNQKEEGLEERILSALEKRGISNFFFLDQSIPFLVRWAKNGLKNIAIRNSYYEPVEMASRFAGLVEWVWFDNLNDDEFDIQAMAYLQNLGFKICFVSPELQGRDFNRHFSQVKRELVNFNLKFDAVCTKFCDQWAELNQ